MQRWEYCAVLATFRTAYFNPEWVELLSFRVDGVVEKRLEDDRKNAIASVIAQLGEQGWEMVGAGSAGEGAGHILYFKRPKP
jgi:hypothetical protein